MAKYLLYQNDNKVQSTLLQGSMGGFILIWLGQVASLMGSGMTCFAQSVWVYTDLGGAITHLTALAVLAQLPGVLVSPIAGALVDRWNRRWVMIICDTVAAMAALTLRTLIVTERFQLWHIYVIVIIISIANHFQWPAYFASVSLMVPKQQLGTANGLIQMGRALGQTAAPFLAGVAVTLFKIQGVILFDLATYLFALITLLIVRIPNPPPSTARGMRGKPLWHDIIYGWKYLVARPGLLGLLMLFAASNFLLGVVGLLVIPLVLSMSSATMLGSIMSVGGVGMLVGSLVMTAWGGPKRRIYGVLGFTLIQGAAIIIAGLGPSLLFLFGAAIVFYFATPIVNACGGIIWQTKVESGVQGRALAASSMVSIGAIELGYLVAGPLADHVFEPLLADGGLLAGSVGQVIGTGPGRGVALMFVVFGALCMLVAVIGYFRPRIRRVDEELPDVVLQGVAVEADRQEWTVKASVLPGDVP